eukprot:231200-Karenia_brevis.AAC.1
MLVATGVATRQGGVIHQNLTPQQGLVKELPTPTVVQVQGSKKTRGKGCIRICTVNITNTSKKVLTWLAKLPYEV